MTPTLARHHTSLPTCEAQVGVAPGLYGLEPVRCRQTVGLREKDGHRYCVKHGEQVAARARRAPLPERCRCGSPQTAAGCRNADCGCWEGPR